MTRKTIIQGRVKLRTKHFSEALQRFTAALSNLTRPQLVKNLALAIPKVLLWTTFGRPDLT